MKNNISDFELIEAYLEDSLSKKETDEFRKRLDDDPEFARQYELRKQTEKLWKDTTVYSRINKNVKQAMSESKKSNYYKPYYFAVAATIILLLSFYIVIHFLGEDIFNRGSSQMAVKNSTEQINLLEPQIKYPDRKANIKYINEANADMDSIILDKLRNEKADTFIKFKTSENIKIEWTSEETGIGYIFVYDISSDYLLIKIPVQLSEREFIIQKSLLKKGKYKWYLFNIDKTGYFEII